jgi:hypothetical protein
MADDALLPVALSVDIHVPVSPDKKRVFVVGEVLEVDAPSSRGRAHEREGHRT